VLSDRIDEFRKLSTQILAISIDSPFSHLRSILSSREEGGLKDISYPLLSDLTQQISRDYKLLTDEGISSAGLVIIDKQGIIQYYSINNSLCGRSINEILRVLKAIQYIQNHPGQVCPVDWEYGDKTLSSYPLKSQIYFKELYSSEKN
jgi:peroxiredoxin (alkyl hydroperoxide reductase subunit C)